MKKKIEVYENILGENMKWAAKIRTLLSGHKTVMLNIIGSPGCGKTALLEVVGKELIKTKNVLVLEGDVETANDAERLAAHDIPVKQIVSHGACHLESQLLHSILEKEDLENLDLVIIENVGNLVCPAEFDLGEAAKIAVLSVTEGEDKPLKYPLLFREAAAIILTKTDLVPHLPFSLDKCLESIRSVNGNVPLFQISSYKNEGLVPLVKWFLSLTK